MGSRGLRRDDDLSPATRSLSKPGALGVLAEKNARRLRRGPMPVTEQTFEQLALEDDDTKWEMVCGKLREKPGMTQEHNSAARRLAMSLARQLDPDADSKSGRAPVTTERATPLPTSFPMSWSSQGRCSSSGEARGCWRSIRTLSPLSGRSLVASTGNYDVDTNPAIQTPRRPRNCVCIPTKRR